MPDSIPKQTEHLSVDQAAGEIHQLMNERPTLPRQEEIAAIIRTVTLRPGEAETTEPWHEFMRLKADLRRFLDEHSEPAESSSEHPDYRAMFDQRTDAIDDFVDDIWSTPAVTGFDILMRAEVALYHENGVMMYLGEGGLDERATAQLIDAVITVGRCTFGLPDDGQREGDV